MIGIYCFTNKINNKKYIGQSKNIKKRINSHHKYDFLNKNNCCYDSKFYQALRKYGYESFEFSILEECKAEELNDREIYWINFYNTYKKGYNSTLGGNNVGDAVKSSKAEDKRRLTRQKTQALNNENHPRAKLSNDEVIKIRQRYIDGETTVQIYEDYKEIFSNKVTLQRIIYGITYKTVENIPKNKHHQTGVLYYKKEEILEIRRLFDNKEKTITEIAKMYNKSYNSIHDIVHRTRYKHIK